MSAQREFERLLEHLGLDHERGMQWFAASLELPEESRERYVSAFRWATQNLESCANHLTAPVVDYLRATRSPGALRAEAMHLDRALRAVLETPTTILDSTEAAVAALLSLHDPRDDGPAHRLREFLPEWRALTAGAPLFAAGEHDPATTYPLLENVAERTLNRALRSLESRDRALFPAGPELSVESFEVECETLRRVAAAGLMPVLRAAFIFLDFTKGGSPATRADWEARGIDLTVHNVASRRVLEVSGRLAAFPQLRESGRTELVLALVECHGMIGQVVRGESTWMMLEPIAASMRRAAQAMKDAHGPAAVGLVVDALRVINTCDTAAVRFGLWTDALAKSFGEIEGHLRRMVSGEPGLSTAWQAERSRFQNDSEWLVDRLLKLRGRRIYAGEPATETADVVARLEPAVTKRLVEQLRHAQIWYGEAATADLRPESQLKLLTIASASVATAGLHHVNLAPLMRSLNDGSRAAAYRVRLVDAVLESSSVGEILEGTAESGPLVALETTIGGTSAGTVELQESPEATALLTLLPIYETKNSAAFHRTLKEMCDLYGLRKDEFDRVANEAIYLQHMNSARSDKERMVEWCVPGTIVEVGPGGGVVLDLIAEAFEDSRIIGLDLSQLVCEALRSRKAQEGRSWEVIEGDAYELPKHVGPRGASTVVFCSVLHEIYSYVSWPLDSEEGRQFQLDSVRAMIRQAWNALGEGGRIVIRDGVKPPPGIRRIRFKDPHGPEFLELFAEQFEGRSIAFEWVDGMTAELSAADAMEFLYCYTWGPASFPYEVREQYGVLEYDTYVSQILDWVADLDGSAHVVELPPGERSYLQPGYNDGLAPKIDLLDQAGEPVDLPDSNCLIVVEKQ